MLVRYVLACIIARLVNLEFASTALLRQARTRFSTPWCCVDFQDVCALVGIPWPSCVALYTTVYVLALAYYTHRDER